MKITVQVFRALVQMGSFAGWESLVTVEGMDRESVARSIKRFAEPVMPINQQLPFVHSVHFYDTDEVLIQRIGSMVLSGIDTGIPALLVMTEDHKVQFQSHLKRRGIDMHAAERDGQICILDAETTLRRFVAGGRTDDRRFQESVGELVRSALSYCQNSGLMVFGEMVAILWEQGHQEAALELERLWNSLLQDSAFHLHCAYPKALFGSNDRAQIEAICGEHSITVGTAAAA